MHTATRVAAIIDGAHATDDAYEVTDPNDGSVIAVVDDCGTEAAALAAESAAVASTSWRTTTIDTRREVLRVAADHLAARESELIELAIADTGSRRSVAGDMQVRAAIERLRAWADAPADLLDLQSPHPSGRVSARVRRQPVGVVACISPYNFPLLAMVAKVAPALFSGNAVIMKPAPQDPLLVGHLAEGLAAGLRTVRADTGVVSFVPGASPAPGQELVEHPAVGAVSFTGSTAVGTEIYRSAAPHMKRLLLELGGKGALIVRADTSLDAVLPAVTRAWTYHAGQVCLTPSRILVHSSRYAEVVAALKDVLKQLRHGDPRDTATDVAPIITAAQRHRIGGMVERAREAGMDVHQSAGVPGGGFHYPATLVSNARPDAEIMREEVFGPVISVMAVDSDDHAVEVANATRYGLYDYVFSADRAAAERLAGRLESAQVGINTIRRHPGAPFGGNKMSGIGRTGGTYALDTYTDLQALVSEDPE
ncbi:hypothetical protein ASD65_13215 [Microbacterium sp. Root61]|uniref:aldehyde dehydrogenase family protein n=1 Tax=Microbacterium sp. Root61 TaxID=1736570 RepID=UPI0006FD4840|nr:aldehyde dehydrogenase family protein [Microbacterium sp. Root61]KRA25272.1 hypothetical protein ASD65_13215 [Microbacterium sp. Root61]